MLRVALTGGIATGKSYVLRLLQARGVPTIDADAVARAVVEPGQPAYGAIRERFGADVMDPVGRLDRARLGAIVFGDPNARADLEGFVHPPVRQAINDWFRARLAMPDPPPFAVADIPLLFETGRDGEFDRVVVVACDPATQLTRVRTRDHLSEPEARQRIDAQLPVADKVARASLLITTDGSFDETARQVDLLCRTLA